LAGILVTLEDIVSGKLHFLLWQAVEKQEHNHLWDADLPRDGCYDLMLGAVAEKSRQLSKSWVRKLFSGIG
jgi:hypothetical protein